MGIYAAVKFTPETDDHLYEFVKHLNVPLNHAKKHYHCTLIYSTKDFSYTHSTVLNGTKARAAKWEVFGVGDNSVLVLRIESKELHQRWKELVAAGASTDFPDYKPHITVACEEEGFDHSKLPLPDFDFVIAHEYQTEIKIGDKWDAKSLIEGRTLTNFKIHLLIERLMVRPREPR